MRLVYRSELARTGYGLSALAYVRHLKRVGAQQGIQVKWAPFFVAASRQTIVPPAAFLSELVKFSQLVAKDEQWQDLADLLVDDGKFDRPDLTVMHCMPHWWHALRSGHGQHIGYLAWESNVWPKAWQPFAQHIDEVMVPSHFNAQALLQAPGWSSLPVHVVPHMYRPAAAQANTEVVDIKRRLSLPEGTTVFYTINDWIPRKNLPGLIRAFCSAFRATDPVALIIKTLPTGQGSTQRAYQSTQHLFQQVLASIHQPNPHIWLWSTELDSQTTDALHTLGDVYVSLSHGEGWGMGAFEAASFGNPVIAPAWGGWVDFLGDQWPGSVSFETTPVPPWAGQDLFTADQQWCEPNEASAAQVMRAFMHDRAPFMAHAQKRQIALRQRFDPDTVAKGMLTQLSADAMGKPADGSAPMVSCVMVMPTDLTAAQKAVSDFLAQSWPHKELVIITDRPHHPLHAWVNALDTPFVHCFCARVHCSTVPSQGALYNQAVALAKGQYVAVWDATARHAPGWLSTCLSALEAQGADVIWLGNHLVWRPHLNRLVRLSSQLWMMSLVARRRCLPAFADQDNILNDPLKALLIGKGRAISLSDSNLYIHVDDDAKDALDADWGTIEQTHMQVVYEGADYQLALGQLNTLLHLVDEPQWSKQLQAPPHRQTVTCQRFDPAEPQPSVVRLHAVELLKQAPHSNSALVSCLMVSRGDISRAKFGVLSFLQQTWPNKELVVVTQQAQSSLTDWLTTLDEPSIRVHMAPTDLTLGELRNASIAHAKGEFIMQWDDDDLSDPERISAFMAVAQRLQVDLVFLSRWLHWWPARRSFCGAVHRVWEGSMLARKSCMVSYPSLPKGEDTDAMQQLVSEHPFALVDWPELYVYTVTGKNTWDSSHFERHWQHATWRAHGLVYDDLLDTLSRRLPIKAYAEALSQEQTPPKWKRVLQYVGSLSEGDGVSHSVRLIDSLLKQAGVETDIFLGCLRHSSDGLPRNEQGQPIPLTDNGHTLLLVHFSLGDGYLAHLMQVYKGSVGMYFHNMTPSSLLPTRADNPLLQDLYALGTEQLRQYQNRYCVVMAASRFSANELTRSYQYREVSVLPALVDTDKWTGRAPEGLTAVNQLVGVPYVLQVSRLMPHKNQLASIAVLNTLRQQHGEDMHLVLVGDTSETAYVHLLRQAVQAQGLGDVVHILGNVPHEELAWLYQHAKVYLCMSEHEGFGMPLLEAALAGCPIVALDNSAKHEVVSGNGTLVSPLPMEDQFARVAAAVYEACRKPPTSAPLGLTDRFSRTTLMAQLMSILRSA